MHVKHLRQGHRPAIAASDHELATLEAAIELVATGVATRVALTNMRRPDLLVDDAERRAAARNLRVRVQWPPDEGPIGLVIETAQPRRRSGTDRRPTR